MSPSASASPKSPWLVYSATAVVRVRVWPRMLPPTVMADPISATTWPKAVVINALDGGGGECGGDRECERDVAHHDRLPGVEPSDAAQRAAPGQEAVQQQPHHHGRKREGGVDDRERGAAPPEGLRREHEAYGDAEPAGEHGGDEADLEREERDAVHFDVA